MEIQINGLKTTIREGVTSSTNASINQRKQQNEDNDTTVNAPKFQEHEIQEEMDKVNQEIRKMKPKVAANDDKFLNIQLIAYL